MWPTVLEIAVGLVMGVLCGINMALLIMLLPVLQNWFLPVMVMSQAIPIFAVAPLLVLWFGYGITAKIITIVLMLFFPIASNFYDGLRRTPNEWLELAQTMQARPINILLKVRIPAAMPALASGLRIAAVFAPMGAIVSEWVGASQGLGFLLLNANARVQVDLLFATLVTLALLTLLLYFGIDSFMKKLIYWQASYA
ncbi:MAG: ABC transporter permease [Gammaproteobacteria bacterium]